MDFWQKLLLQSVGPLITAVVGTLIIGTFVAWITIGLATQNLLERNAGEEHTGLTVEQLRDQSLLLKTYREKLFAGAQAVLQGPIRPWAG